MANRLMVRNYMTLEKGPVAIYLQAAIGAVGAPTLSALNSKGVLSITRTGVGAYTIALGGAAGVDTYQRLLFAGYQSIIAGGSSALQMKVLQDNSANLAAPNIHVAFYDAAGVAVELGNGESLIMEMVFSNSTGN